MKLQEISYGHRIHRCKTFIDYSGKYFLEWLDDTGELIWMSERDGWCHLYLYDVVAGRVKNRITTGAWVVRNVVHVDAKHRQVWFMASGLRPDEDPYHVHLCRVGFDGDGFVRLTEGDGNHRVEFSPDREYFVDTWSRADHPPVVELRRSDDGRLICELERADASALLAAGWTMPERFVADVVFDRVRGPVVLELNPLYCSGFNVPQAHAQVVTLLAQDLLSLEAPDVIDQASGEGWWRP